jgi:hypothetical protein
MSAPHATESELLARLEQDVDLDAGRLPAYLFSDPDVYER